MQEERRLVQQPLRRLDALDDDAARHRVQLRVLLGRQLATGKDNHRDVGERCVVADRFEQVETRHVGQPEIEHDAIRRLLADRGERFLAGTDGHQVDVVMPQKLGDAARLGGVVFDNQEALAAWLYVVLDPRQRGLEVLRRAWLVDKGEGAAGEPVLAVLVERDDLHRDVSRCRVLLQLAQHGPAQHVGQEDVERDRCRLIFAGEGEGLRAAHRDQDLQALVMRQIGDNPRVVGIVLDDQQDRLTRLDALAVVRHRLDRLGEPARHQDHWVHQRLAGWQRRAVPRADAGIAKWQIERKGAADIGRAAQLDLAAEQIGEFSADREAEARAAVFAVRAGISLLERFEDDALFLRRNADTGIGHLEHDDAGGAVQHRVVRAPAARSLINAELDPAMLGELEGVRQQVLEHLLQPLRVSVDAAVELGIELHVEGQLAAIRLMPERPRHHIDQVIEEDVLDIHRHRAGLDLRQVENVADQVEKVGAGAVDRAGELDLFRRQIAVRVVTELLTQDQDAVQGRAQLMRHIGEELGFILRGQRQLSGLLFERAAGLLDFLVLRLDFDVALGELLRLLLELFVGLLQFALLALQFGGELLRLLQQALGLHRRFDTVQHDTDAGGQLFEKRDLQTGEVTDRRQFDDRLDLTFEQHRQHDQIVWQDLEKTGN